MKRYLICAATLVLGMALMTSCAKKPELGQGEAAGLGPTPTAGTVAPSGSTAPPRTDTAISRPTAPSESRLPQSAGAGAAARPAGGGNGNQAAGPLQDVFFDFDKDAIREDQRGALDANVGWLKSQPAAKITVEGHADERGTNEYNLALGDRRAKTTRDYLVSKGIEAVRVTTVSYGEERPFVLGHDESAWRWNRRSHFAITAQ